MVPDSRVQSPFFSNDKPLEAEPVPDHTYGYHADPVNQVGNKASTPVVTATSAYTYRPTASAPPFYYDNVK